MSVTIYTQNLASVLIVAAYDGDERMINSQTVDISGVEALNGIIPVTMNLTGAERVQAMIWRNTVTLEPLCKMEDIVI